MFSSFFFFFSIQPGHNHSEVIDVSVYAPFSCETISYVPGFLLIVAVSIE